MLRVKFNWNLFVIIYDDIFIFYFSFMKPILLTKWHNIYFSRITLLLLLTICYEIYFLDKIFILNSLQKTRFQLHILYHPIQNTLFQIWEKGHWNFTFQKLCLWKMNIYKVFECKRSTRTWYMIDSICKELLFFLHSYFEN